MDYISTKPDTLQAAAVIARARQLTDFKWTPVCDVPTYTLDKGNTVLTAGTEVTGFPYSSTERTDKFITENVSVETFLSVIPDPYSKLYQAGKGAFNSCNYGVVCNGLVRYAFGIKRRVSTKCWPTIPGMRRVARRGEYNVNDIKLCDVLYAVNEGRNHVALITDILKDESGEVVAVEVSEAARPLCKRTVYQNAEFFKKHELFALWRYDYLDKVPLLDESVVNLLKNNPYVKQPEITVDNGNKSNYLEGEEVIVSALIPDNDVIEVICDGNLIEEIKVLKKAVITRKFKKGYYVLKLKNSARRVEFCVNKASIDYKIENGTITVHADPCDGKSEILYMDFRIGSNDYGWASLAKYENLTPEEISSGIFTRKIPDNGKNFKVYFKNRYGVWVHKMMPV